MKVKIIKNPFDDWDHFEFQTFTKGIEVTIHKESEHFNWYEAEIQGKETFIPKHFITDKRLNRDYNPTELDVKIGDVIEVKEIHTLWLFVKDMQGNTGWILRENVASD